MKLLATILMMATIFLSTKILAQQQSITVKVPNVTSDSGKVSFALFKKDNFMKKPLKTISAKVIDGIAEVTFENVVTGDYAITCYHDKNGNGKMDFQSNGMPLEDYGATNNNMNFGPPQFKDAKFTLMNEDISLEIKF